ncbi:MAG: hypothetical protein Q7U47_03655 [Paludibacter sp.]|nr:hypothetical protein [Paludibacter sp.]
MKSTRNFFFVLAVIFVSMFHTYATKPQNTKEELAEMYIEKMNKDVALTDSQKVEIKKRFIKYVTKIENAHSKSDKSEAIKSKKISTDEYQMSLDSILTNNQRETINQKNGERTGNNTDQKTK